MRNPSQFLVRAILILALLQIVAGVAQAGDREFHLLVDRVSAHCHKRPMRFMGWLNFLVNRFPQQGVSHFQMVIFDEAGSSCMPMDDEFVSSLTSLVGNSYQPFVRVRDARSGELSCIYIRGAGDKSFEMLIVAIDLSGAVLMKMQIKPEAMRDWMDEPIKRGRESRENREGY
jgi:hypothetical protein